MTVYQTSALEKITEQGFLDPDGKEEKVDAIILATGFNTSWVPRLPIISNGSDLQDVYTKRPISYLGIAAPGTPNYFTFFGPYGPLGTGSAIPLIEAFTTYIIKIIKKMQVEDIKSISPKQHVADEFAEHAELFNRRTVWDSPCRSWYKGGKIDGRVLLYPGSRVQ